MANGTIISLSLVVSASTAGFILPGAPNYNYHLWLDSLAKDQTGCTISDEIDSYGRARGNTFTERLWRTNKYEEVYLYEYASPKETCRNLAQ